MEGIARKQGIERWAEKTPAHVLQMLEVEKGRKYGEELGGDYVERRPRAYVGTLRQIIVATVEIPSARDNVMLFLLNSAGFWLFSLQMIHGLRIHN
jgi:hypothetical protein